MRVGALMEEKNGRKWVRFEVRDTGVGVPLEKREEIFKEFMQADSSHARKFGGTGLGLAITKKLINAMGGDIGVDAAPGGGSLFWCTLPLIALREADNSEASILSGMRVAIADLNEAGAIDAAKKLGSQHIGVAIDVRDRASVTAAFDKVVAHFGGYDVLAANAGVSSMKLVVELEDADWDFNFDVNAKGVFLTNQAAVKYFLAHKKKGVIVNTASLAGKWGAPWLAHYSASKFALVGMSEAWRAEFARFDVDVLTVVPGLTNSGFQNNWLRTDGKADLRFGEGMTPEYLAARVVKAIRTNKTETVCGSEARRLLLFNRFFPRLTNWLIARKVKRLYAK